MLVVALSVGEVLGAGGHENIEGSGAGGTGVGGGDAGTEGAGA